MQKSQNAPLIRTEKYFKAARLPGVAAGRLRCTVCSGDGSASGFVRQKEFRTEQ